MAKRETIAIEAGEGNLSEARAFVEHALSKQRVNSTNTTETLSLFEALFHEIVHQAESCGDELEITSISKLGRIDIEIAFSGERFSLPEKGTSSASNAELIDSLSDKMSCSYEGGCNVVHISASKSPWVPILPSVIAIVAALLVSLVLKATIDDAGQQYLAKEWIAPLEKLFTNAMLMIGAPMTLFSLLKNVTDAFIVAKRHSSPRRLFITAVSSSVAAIALALIMGFVFAQYILSATGVTERVDIGFANWTLSSGVDQIIPSSIVQPFETISPIPMIVVALLIAGALRSIGKSFDLAKRAIDVCYDLFSGILQIIMIAFPLACFLLFLEVLLVNGVGIQITEIFIIGVLIFVCTVPLLGFYALRIKARGVHILQFTKKLWPLVKENFAIGSIIDAVPYNTRYCIKNYGIPRERLDRELPILAQVSLDGNCFILMLLATIYIFVANCEVSWFHIGIVALIVLFLSFGAPNQPGSILIGMLVILTYLNSDSIISLALCFELFCGGLQNILNVISAVVTVAEDECRENPNHPKMP